ncbi:MAG: hypothetical protein ACFFD6_01045 [Candidatus Thorarchaeota archaeon]
MNIKDDRTTVRVRFSADCYGLIKYTPRGPVLLTETMSKLSTGFTSFETDSVIIVDSRGRSTAQPLIQRAKIKVKPFLVIRRTYAVGLSQTLEQIWPPSTEGWYGRLTNGIEEAIFTIQQISDDSRYWLTVSDPLTNQIYEFHYIQQYEANALIMQEGSEFDNQINLATGPTDKEAARNEILSILDESPPTLTQITRLTTNLVIPDIKIGKTMRETLDKLVPRSFPSDIREEMMAFLAWVIRDKLPDDDPVDFFTRLLPTPIFRSLVMGHTKCLIEKVTPPPYLRLMIMAEKGKQELLRIAAPESLEKEPWSLAWYGITERMPDWREQATKLALDLNESKKISTGLPITRSRAQRNRSAWINRFIMLSSGLSLRANVMIEALGLRQIAYLGSAYRWPHNHLAWSARLGDVRERPPYLQIMIVPPAAAERIGRILPSVIKIEWAARSLNLNLFIVDEKQSMNLLSKALETLSSSSSLKKLINRYGKWQGLGLHGLEPEEARVIDMMTGNTFLADLEDERYLKYWSLTKPKLRSVLSRLRDEGILQIQYEVANPRLESLFILGQGPPEKIYSLTQGLLRNTPTSLAMVAEGGGKCIVISKVPDKLGHHLLASLPEKGEENGVAIRCMRPRVFRSYTHNLYQRLLRKRGDWNDDIGGFLSQARSMQKSLSEDNL